MDEQQFMFLVHEHPTFALLVMRVMAERLRNNTGPWALDSPFRQTPRRSSDLLFCATDRGSVTSM